MARVSIGDIITSTLWTQDFINEDPILKNILESGILTSDAKLDKLVNALEAGVRFELPYIDEPEYSEPTYGDDSDNRIDTDKIAWSNMFAILTLANKAYQLANITEIINRDSDPAKRLREILAMYWSKDLQNRIIASIVGISAKAGSDLTLDVSDDSTDGADVLLDSAVLVDGVGLQGDHQDKFGFMFVHSKVYGDLKKQQLIDFMQASEVGAKPIPYYGGYRVFVNDLLPVENGTNKKKYTTIISQNALFAYSQKKIPNAFAIDTDEMAGNGSGITTLISRNGFVLHPVGFSYLGTDSKVSLANLKDSAKWSNKFKAKQHRFVKIVTN